ncbi:MAG: C2H2-type zinc finger protein [Dehalococcoidales bacterium]|nr:C2H2-type zinc finger protein [Dehalococcoidales bacterium]
MSEEIKCDICGKSFKTTQALAGHMQGACGKNHPETTTGVARESRSGAKPGALDTAIEKLQVPIVPEAYNGSAQAYWEGFNRGVSYGANTILVGIRSAQELSSLGISQATPLIKMAQEMRQAEGQAAQTIAAEMAGAVMQGNQQLMGAINNLAVAQPNAPNPMAQVMAETLKPVLQQVMQSLMGGLMGGFKLGQQPAAGQPVQAVPAQEQSLPRQSVSSDDWGALPDNVIPISKEDLDV